MPLSSLNAPADAGQKAASLAVSSVCVYCGTGSDVDDVYRSGAAALGATLAAADVRLVYGGGSVGLMGIVSKSAMDAGGRVLGIIPAHLSEKEGQAHDITELVIVDSMHARKTMMVDNADAFVVLPGGLGTLEEMFEILTWKYLGLHDKPVIILNIGGYYDPLLAMIDHMIAKGFTPERHRQMYAVANTVADVLPLLAGQPASRIECSLEKL